MHMGTTYQANQLVFVDETGMNRNTSSCRYGWAPCGERAHCCDFFVHGTKFVLDSLVILILLIMFKDTPFSLLCHSKGYYMLTFKAAHIRQIHLMISSVHFSFV